MCLSAVTYGDSSTTSQAEVLLEWIHAFYWEMGPFTCSVDVLMKTTISIVYKVINFS